MLGPFDLNLRHIDAVLAVAREGSVSAASGAVNLSQPALTQALTKLEILLDQRLFDRLPGGTVPTPAGATFIARAARALDHLVAGGRRIRRAARLPQIAYIERRVTMGQLRALSSVERSGSYVMAARELRLAQPSVHRAVKELELILGQNLLVRVGRTVRATAAAVRFVRSIRLMVAELQAGLDELAALVRAGTGRVVVGTLPLPRARLLPEALALLMSAYEQAEVTIVEGSYTELLMALRGGEIDILVGALRDPAPSSDVVQRPLLDDDLFVVGRADHPLAGDEVPTLEALASFPWIVGASGAPMRAVWETMFAARRPARRIECGSVLTARGLMLRGEWLALLSSDQFRVERDAGLLAAVAGPVPGSRRRIGIALRADWRPTAIQSALIDALTAAAQPDTSGI
ncbi:LysR family transcriptional regulator [Aureimonas sp. ME7]|uniref:LysR family transcriptional regulator n=1 Tax=Aureimonas sp. ME7 TaxID=2744252 RepID=UPI0015F558D5|nr:LysR family transcriptional regulator [Aureimonas sp. ME7]